MTERRPQWDDDLIDTVRSHFYENGFVEEVFGVIAAVEDWHRDRWTGVCESPEEVVRELKQAQAAMQRVRDLIGELGSGDFRLVSAGGSITVDVLPVFMIRRALDGDCDE